jgi:hypothetical protein
MITESQIRQVNQFLFNQMLDGKTTVRVKKYHVCNKMMFGKSDFIETCYTSSPPLVKTIRSRKNGVVSEDTVW